MSLLHACMHAILRLRFQPDMKALFAKPQDSPEPRAESVVSVAAQTRSLLKRQLLDSLGSGVGAGKRRLERRIHEALSAKDVELQPRGALQSLVFFDGDSSGSGEVGLPVLSASGSELRKFSLGVFPPTSRECFCAEGL